MNAKKQSGNEATSRKPRPSAHQKVKHYNNGRTASAKKSSAWLPDTSSIPWLRKTGTEDY